MADFRAAPRRLKFQYGRRCRRLFLAATSQGVLMVPGRLRFLLKMASPRRFADPSYLSRIGPELYGGAARGRPDLLAAHPVGYDRPRARGYLYQMLATWGWTSLWWLPWLCQPTLIAGTVPARSIAAAAQGRVGEYITIP
jgi:hypothetical protein